MLPRFDMYSLQLFIAVVEEGSITAAAEREFIAASALSKRIAELERTLGAALLSRHARGVEPTQAGHTLARGARALLHQAGDLFDELSGYAQGTRGHVRLAANLSSITQFLAADLKAFLQSFPAVTVDLNEMVSTEVTRAVAENTADIGIYTQADEQYGLDIYRYERDRMVVVTPAGHPLASRTAVAFADTLDYEHVGMHRGSAANRLFAREASALKRTLTLRFQVTSYDALISMVKAGLGIGIMPLRSTQLYVPSGLAIVALTDDWAARELRICVRDRDSLSEAARTLLAYLTDRRHMSD